MDWAIVLPAVFAPFGVFAVLEYVRSVRQGGVHGWDISQQPVDLPADFPDRQAVALRICIRATGPVVRYEVEGRVWADLPLRNGGPKTFRAVMTADSPPMQFDIAVPADALASLKVGAVWFTASSLAQRGIRHSPGARRIEHWVPARLHIWGWRRQAGHWRRPRWWTRRMRFVQPDETWRPGPGGAAPDADLAAQRGAIPPKTR